jgi:glycosyltransferase involved in cell wall biosynthesis
MAECQRDIAIARSLGFLGQVFAPTPASGGTDFSTLPALADLAPPSRRNEILIKGYHGWAGRGLHILSAIHLAAPALRKYKIRVILAGEASAEMIQEIRRHDGLDIELSGYVDTHAEAMERLARARFVIGMGVSDGISTTLLEAMSLGVFPIQGDTSCACEWVRPGIDAFLLSPHDVRGLADAITRAATDDKLVNAAAITNRATVEQRWDVNRNARFARECYERMLDLHPVHGAGRGEA